MVDVLEGLVRALSEVLMVRTLSWWLQGLSMGDVQGLSDARRLRGGLHDLYAIPQVLAGRTTQTVVMH